MIPVMTNPSLLVAGLRAHSGLSQRALAARVGCSRSTIVRIESGEMDPTFTMLARVAAAAGQRLTIEAKQTICRKSLAAIAAETLGGDPEDTPWTRIRGLIDWIRLHPDVSSDAIADPPLRTTPQLDNLLAAIANKVADDQNSQRPSWTADVPIPAEPWHAPGTPRMRASERAKAPRQFIERNIHLAEANFWRSK
jgi:transcriptional regulator with XRE-family HTH domain